MTENRSKEEGSLLDFVQEVRDLEPACSRPSGTAVFLTSRREVTPLALRANLEHNHVLHESVVILTMEIERVPHVDEKDRLTIDDLGIEDDGISHLVASFGFQDELNVPEVLHQAAEMGLETKVDLDEVSYFLSRITVVPNGDPTMRRWRKKLFVAISNNSGNLLAEQFGLPVDRTVVMGAEVAL